MERAERVEALAQARELTLGGRGDAGRGGVDEGDAFVGEGVGVVVGVGEGGRGEREDGDDGREGRAEGHGTSLTLRVLGLPGRTVTVTVLRILDSGL